MMLIMMFFFGRRNNPTSLVIFARLARMSSKTGNKIRQHVNPLSHAKMQPMQLPTTWISDNFGSNSNNGKNDRFILDIGSGKGQWALDMAVAHKDVNIVAIEIRKPAVEIANARIKDANEQHVYKNLMYLNGNINVDISRILVDCLSFGAKSIDIAIQFPDPHFKTRNFKRRVVNDSFVETLDRLLPIHSKVFIQTDIEEVAKDFARKFLNSRLTFQIYPGYSLEQLHSNASPYYPIETERERNSIKEHLKIYRILFEKKG